jgi:hypothetical protein
MRGELPGNDGGVERRGSSGEHDQGTSSSWAALRRQESISTLDRRRTARQLGRAIDGWRGLVQDGGAQRDANEPDMEGGCNSRGTAERGIGSIGSRASRPKGAWAGGKGDETMHGWQGRSVEAPQGTSHGGVENTCRGSIASTAEAKRSASSERAAATRPSEL